MSLDDLIVYEAGGASIPAIVDERGWRGFRELEFEVCVKAGRAFDGFALIDAGGGVVTDLDENGEEVFSQRKVDALKAKGGVIVFLDRDVDYLIERIAGDSNRPDLNASKSFREIMERRLPWYKKAADFIVDGGGERRERTTVGEEEAPREYYSGVLLRAKRCGTFGRPVVPVGRGQTELMRVP